LAARFSSKDLSDASLAEDFGAGSEVAREGVAVLWDALHNAGDGAEADAAQRQWIAALHATFGSDCRRLEKGLNALAAVYPVPGEPELLALLFAVQTYYVLVVKLLVWQAVARARQSDPPVQTILNTPGSDRLLRFVETIESEYVALGSTDGTAPADPLAWYTRAWSQPMDAWFRRMATVWSEYDFAAAVEDPVGTGDLLKTLYQGIFPKRFRHVLGEYYTPDWLVEQMLDEAGYTGAPGVRLLDPACGSGGFLASAIRRFRARWADNNGCEAVARDALRRAICSAVVGIDLNPLAVLTARANYLIAILDLLPSTGSVEAPVFLGDSILGRHERLQEVPGQFDCVVGNPPWIAWDDLPADNRQATKPLWQQYGLFSLSGSDARHGGGKKDLSMLMIYAAADRYLKPSGRLAMVVTQTVFQTRGAGDGFRRFRLGDEGAWLKVLRVNDLVELRPFPGTANWSATVVLEKGFRTAYPVPYVKYLADGTRRQFDAVPIDPNGPTSPWFLRPREWKGTMEELIGPADYKAHLGANTGGANGVYWVTPCGESDPEAGPGSVRVRNVAERGKRRAAVVEHLVESDLLYPLLRWSDIDRFSARPATWLLLAQDVETRRGIPEAQMRRNYPNAYAYLSQFRELLEGRAAYRRYQSRAAFYSMYNIGPYTVAPIKVVWRRMDRRIHAAVVEPVHFPRLGVRPMIPQETCAMVAADSADEAHYLCAVLNSSLVGFLVASHSVRGGKGFGSPGMLDFLRIRRYDPGKAIHRDLAAGSREAHCLRASGGNVTAIQRDIDQLGGHLWGIESPDA
jgi:hypothetical protein